MKAGINKAELFHPLEKQFQIALEFVLESHWKVNILTKKDQFIALLICATCARKLAKKNGKYVREIKKDGYNVVYFKEYLKMEGIPERLNNEFRHFLEEQQLIISLDAKHYWHGDIFQEALRNMRSGTGTEFTLQKAKEIPSPASAKKLLVPFLEKLDGMGLTRRVENNRVWTEKKDTNSSI